MQRGKVEGIYVASRARELPQGVRSARAVAGRGLEGDRYFDDAGTFSDRGRGDGRDLTLVEAEALTAVAEQGIKLTPQEARRNVLTTGVALNDLVGRRFRIGQVECVGRRLCEPCDHLEKLTEPGVLRALAHRGGLRADIVSDGEITVGDHLDELPGKA